MKLYYHKTDGGAKYLTDKYVICPNGNKEGIFEGASYVIRFDGDITKDAEINIVDRTGQEIRELKDKLHRRNVQIKELKEKIGKLKEIRKIPNALASEHLQALQRNR